MILSDFVFMKYPAHQSRCCNSHVLPCSIDLLVAAPCTAPWSLKVEAADVVVAGAVPHGLLVCDQVCVSCLKLIEASSSCIHWRRHLIQARLAALVGRGGKSDSLHCIGHVSLYMAMIQHHAHTPSVLYFDIVCVCTCQLLYIACIKWYMVCNIAKICKNHIFQFCTGYQALLF